MIPETLCSVGGQGLDRAAAAATVGLSSKGPN